MRIVVDAMGSDNRPTPDVAGAVMAAREYGLDIVLVGDERVIAPTLAAEDTAGLKVDVVHAPEAILMNEHPTEAARAKKNSSMHVGMNLVKEGAADGFVSAGNTGGLLAVATLHTLRRIPGVMRPALTVTFHVHGQYILLCDIGANVDCKPEWLQQFALMTALYAERVLKIANPRVGLLANGEEDTKGNELIKKAAELIRQTHLNFIGNVEPKEVLVTHQADVVIQDGFVGNILIKTYGATAELILNLMREGGAPVAARRPGATSRQARPAQPAAPDRPDGVWRCDAAGRQRCCNQCARAHQRPGDQERHPSGARRDQRRRGRGRPRRHRALRCPARTRRGTRVAEPRRLSGRRVFNLIPG
ncbi:MAG: phosphate acyltransferase PlsX [Anaerolineae bacterium]|nr:phosphate acyltransferase PlsX [Anaerolineae bacterium]